MFIESRRLCNKAVSYPRIPQKGFGAAGPHPEADRRRLVYGRYAVHQFFGTDRYPCGRTEHFHTNGIPLAKGAGEKSANRIDPAGAS